MCVPEPVSLAAFCLTFYPVLPLLLAFRLLFSVNTCPDTSLKPIRGRRALGKSIAVRRDYFSMSWMTLLFAVSPSRLLLLFLSSLPSRGFTFSHRSPLSPHMPRLATYSSRFFIVTLGDSREYADSLFSGVVF